MHILLLLVLVIGGSLAALSYAESKGIDRKRAERWVFGALAAVAVALVLARAGLHWLVVGAGALAAFAGKAMRLLQVAQMAKNLGGGARRPAQQPANRPARMTREQALEVLGLDPSASRQEILDEYKRLMKKVHPDTGGSKYLATQLNEAKDVLLG